MNIFKIEKNIAVPPRVNGGRGFTSEWKGVAMQLAVGDSVCFTNAKDSNRFSTAVTSAFGKGSACQRKIDNKTFRVWRIK